MDRLGPPPGSGIALACHTRSSVGLVGGPLKNLADPVSSNYRKIALRPLWAAMAGSPAPPTAGPRWSSGRSRWPRAASCCLPAGRGVRRCHASPRWHRCGRCFNLAGALVDDLEVDGGARRDNGPLSLLQIGSPSPSLHKNPTFCHMPSHKGSSPVHARMCSFVHV